MAKIDFGATEHNRLLQELAGVHALLEAILRKVGPVTLTQTEAEAKSQGGRLKSVTHPDGSMTLTLEGGNSPALDKERSSNVESHGAADPDELAPGEGVAS